MSINAKFSIVVREVPPPAVAGLLAALGGVMREESLVEDTVVEQAEPGVVQVYTPSPVILSGFGRWHPAFEARIKQVVEASAPGTVTKFFWTFPDED